VKDLVLLAIYNWYFKRAISHFGWSTSHP